MHGKFIAGMIFFLLFLPLLPLPLLSLPSSLLSVPPSPNALLTACDDFCPSKGGVIPYLCSTTRRAKQRGRLWIHIKSLQNKSILMLLCVLVCHPRLPVAPLLISPSASFFFLSLIPLTFISDPCFGISCGSTFITNDWALPAYCASGLCTVVSVHTNSSMCHSQPSDTCANDAWLIHLPERV